MNDGTEPEIKGPDGVDPPASTIPAEDGHPSGASAAELTEAPVQAAAEVAQAASTTVPNGFAAETANAFQAARERLQSMSDIAFGQYGGVMTGLPKTQSGLSSPETMATYQAATAAMTELSSKVIDAWRANTETAFAHWNKMRSVKTWSEAIQLNAEHTRLQMENMSAQTRELSTLAGQIARTSMDGFKKAGR